MAARSFRGISAIVGLSSIPPAFPAGLLTLALSRAMRHGLAPEDQAQNKSDPQSGHDRLHGIFAHVIFPILLQGADAHFRVVPSLSSLIAIILRHRHRG